MNRVMRIKRLGVVAHNEYTSRGGGVDRQFAARRWGPTGAVKRANIQR